MAAAFTRQVRYVSFKFQIRILKFIRVPFLVYSGPQLYYRVYDLLQIDVYLIDY